MLADVAGGGLVSAVAFVEVTGGGAAVLSGPVVTTGPSPVVFVPSSASSVVLRVEMPEVVVVFIVDQVLAVVTTGLFA